MTTYDTDGTLEAVCPHCGYADPDSWELDSRANEGERDCPSCGRPHWWVRRVVITFETGKLDEEEDGELGEEDVEGDEESDS